MIVAVEPGEEAIVQQRRTHAGRLQRLRGDVRVVRLARALRGGDEEIRRRIGEAHAALFAQLRGDAVVAVQAAIGLRIEQRAQHARVLRRPRARVHRLEEAVDARVGRAHQQFTTVGDERPGIEGVGIEAPAAQILRDGGRGRGGEQRGCGEGERGSGHVDAMPCPMPGS